MLVNIGEKIRQIRESKKISQEKMEELTGIARTNISSYENGKTKPNLETIEKFAKALKIHPTELLYGYSEKKLHELHKSMERPPNAIDAPAYLDEDIPVISLVKAGRGGFFDDQGYPVGEGLKLLNGGKNGN